MTGDETAGLDATESEAPIRQLSMVRPDRGTVPPTANVCGEATGVGLSDLNRVP